MYLLRCPVKQCGRYIYFTVIYMTCMNCILAFLLVLTCDLLMDRCIHVADLFLFVSLLYN